MRADPGERVGPQGGGHVDDRDPGAGDALGVGEHEVGVAVAVGVDRLHEDDPAGDDTAPSHPGGAPSGGSGSCGRGRGRVGLCPRLDAVGDQAVVVPSRGHDHGEHGGGADREDRDDDQCAAPGDGHGRAG
jgi:hypothetical protein